MTIVQSTHPRLPGLCDLCLPPEHRAPAERRRGAAFAGEDSFEARSLCGALQLPRLIVQALQRFHFLFASEACRCLSQFSTYGSSRHRPLSARDRDGGPCRHGPAKNVRDRGSDKARRAPPPPPWQAIARARADTGRQQKIGKIHRVPLGRRGERTMQTAKEHVARTHVMMRRHVQIRQVRLRGRRFRQRGKVAEDCVGTAL